MNSTMCKTLNHIIEKYEFDNVQDIEYNKEHNKESDASI